MFLQYLLACIALRVFHSQAKVVNSFNECNVFFYKGKEPQGMDVNAVKICQMTNQSTVFATLYSVGHRIPLYSAYTFDYTCLKTRDGRSCSRWNIEPQLIHGDKPDYMMIERQINFDPNVRQTLKRNQAINDDYRETGYDRGHLYPNSFDCNDPYKVTYTLTNVAPMDPCFNQMYWKKLENELKKFLLHKLKDDVDVTVYIVTGAVPGDDRIPEEDNCGDRESKRVTVPSHIWTAVCYKHDRDDKKSFSFGYIAKNHPEYDINLMSMSDMNVQLSTLYSRVSRSSSPIRIFDDDCFSDPSKVVTIFKTFQIKSTQLKILQDTFDVAQNNFNAVKIYESMSIDSESLPAKRPRLTELTAIFAFDSFISYFTSLEKLKDMARSACIITSAKQRHWSAVHSELRKREVSEGSESVQCHLVPEKSVDGKTAADGSSCSDFKHNGNRCTCTTEKGKVKLCCSTPCLYQDRLKDYRCYSGETQIKCSPQYSLIAIRGKRCLDEHPCATYGEDYYWCYTAFDLFAIDWEYCSPPLLGSKAKDGQPCRDDHACAKYGSRTPWCYTDDDESWNYCCTSDDCFSAVNYKTCKTDHRCGYYGKNYLWCRTTDNSWNYCCKACCQ